MSVDRLMSLVDACVPDWYQSLADSDTSRSSSVKRVRQAVDRTIQYLDSCIDIQKTLPVSSWSVVDFSFVVLNSCQFICLVQSFSFSQ